MRSDNPQGIGLNQKQEQDQGQDQQDVSQEKEIKRSRLGPESLITSNRGLKVTCENTHTTGHKTSPKVDSLTQIANRPQSLDILKRIITKIVIIRNITSRNSPGGRKNNRKSQEMIIAREVETGKEQDNLQIIIGRFQEMRIMGGNLDIKTPGIMKTILDSKKATRNRLGTRRKTTQIS